MKTKNFPHGVHPPEFKELTENKALQPMPPPEKVMIPLLQHFGKPAEPLVQKGDEVLLGQKIGEGQGLFSAAVHSSVSGKVLSVDTFNHPGGSPVPAVTVNNDSQDKTLPGKKEIKDPFSLSPEEVREKVKEAGVVGLGEPLFLRQSSSLLLRTNPLIRSSSTDANANLF